MSNQQAQTPPILEIHAPEITLLSRVTSMPIISSSLDTINGALSSNAYTHSAYICLRKGALDKRLEHLQVKLAPLVVRVDGYATMAIDAVESRYPYPFKVKPEEVATFGRRHKER
ncbi:hypothetical protein BDZ97DRAFT_1842677 [Flammula alnicola]|nr:hypothetical protein BDZ97DRAFT_1842677 [Flammula alnicola]